MALASAAKKHTRDDIDVRVSIDRDTGGFHCFRRWLIVADDPVEHPERQITVSEAVGRNPQAVPGEYIEDLMEDVTFDRIGAQAAKQVIFQKIRDAEREQNLNDFLDRGEYLVYGVIKRMDRGNAIIEFGKIEAVLPRDQMISHENLRMGDRVRAYLLRIDRSVRGPQLVLSRTSPAFLAKLFELEVPEIEEGFWKSKQQREILVPEQKSLSNRMTVAWIRSVPAWVCAVREYRQLPVSLPVSGWISFSGRMIRPHSS